jgi:hypothetical protein
MWRSCGNSSSWVERTLAHFKREFVSTRIQKTQKFTVVSFGCSGYLVWLTLTEPLDALTFKWKTVENLRRSHVTAAEQAFFHEICSRVSEFPGLVLSTRIWRLPSQMSPYLRAHIAVPLIPRPFPANFRNTSNAEGWSTAL